MCYVITRQVILLACYIKSKFGPLQIPEKISGYRRKMFFSENVQHRGLTMVLLHNYFGSPLYTPCRIVTLFTIPTSGTSPRRCMSPYGFIFN